MAKQAKTVLKNWFLTALKPLQQHYHDWMDSYWHKDELIPGSSVDIEIPDFPDPGVIETLISLVEPVVIETSIPVTHTMTADRLLQTIVITTDTEQTISISLTVSGGEIAEGDVIPAGGWASWDVNLYNRSGTPLYFEGITAATTIKLYYR